MWGEEKHLSFFFSWGKEDREVGELVRRKTGSREAFFAAMVVSVRKDKGGWENPNCKAGRDVV